MAFSSVSASPSHRSPFHWVAPAGLLALAAACGSRATDPGEVPVEVTCSLEGSSFSAGESFVMDCNRCTCEADGSVSCEQRGCTPGTCRSAGTTYQAGDTFAASDGCNTCECGADGSISCTERDCPPMACIVGDRQIALGQDFTTPDECGICTCEMDGTVSCSNVGCQPASCTLEGVTYEIGESFLAADTCNTCTCTESGLECTDRVCPVAACDGFGLGETASDGCSSCVCTQTGFVCSLVSCAFDSCGGSQAATCDSGQFCDYAGGTCGVGAAEGSCKRPPDFCTAQVDPVCGCDGETYSNACRAAAASVSVSHEGACDTSSLGVGESCGGLAAPDASTCGEGSFCQHQAGAACGATDAPGECVRIPEACIEIFNPVCGCDGETYSSECHAALAQVSIFSTGECE